MPTVVRLVKHHDWKFAPRVWKGEVEEIFRLTKKIKTDYTVVDGQIVRERATTYSYDSALAARSPQVPDPPTPTTFLYSDGNFKKDVEFIFQKTRIVTKTYEAYGPDSYLVNIDDYNVLTGVTTHTTQVIDGKIPLAPTINSSLTNLVQQPIVGVLDDNCDFVPGTTTVDGGYCDDGEEGAKVSRRSLQRATAIVRRVKHGANPLMKLGQTIQLIDAKRDLNARHVLTRRTVECKEDGGADETLEMEFWIR